MLRTLGIAVLVLFTGTVRAQSLGETTFPNSGTPEAQEAFMRGLLLLHSFEYDHAREAFQEARAIDPGFAMAMWGEAMTYNHPIWQQQDTDQAWRVTSSFGDYPDGMDDTAIDATERERAYLKTLRILFDPLSGEKEDRDDAYERAMGELASAYPEDENAALFHALSVLGTAHEGRDLTIYDRAGRIVVDVFERNPLNPGAAHYVIHAYDDPMNAEKALEAAEAYSEIAPDAPHALHMPTHIYFALGIWDKGAELNRRSYEAAKRRDEAEVQPLGGHGWHPLYWLHYAELQRGRWEEAERLLQVAADHLENKPSRRGWGTLVAMRAQHLVSTRNPYAQALNIVINEEMLSPGSRQVHDFVTGLIALSGFNLQSDGMSPADSMITRMQDRFETSLEDDSISEILLLQLQAWRNQQSNSERAWELLEEAAALEDALPLDFGPPHPAMPTHEIMGEWLLGNSRAGQNLNERLETVRKAQVEFETVLERMPNRLRSLDGLREAATATGDEEARIKALNGLCIAYQSGDPPGQQERLIGELPAFCENHVE